MAMVRKNPLPAGRYWIDIPRGSQDIWDLWLKKNADVVHVEKKESDSWLKTSITNYIFTVDEPTIWPRGVGFPNTAGAEVKKKADVVQRPPPPTAADVVKDIAQTASEAATQAYILAAIVVVAVLWSKSGK
jgi:hypothetical protein